MAGILLFGASEKLGAELVVAVEADQVRLVRQADFFQHDRGLDPVGRGQRVQLQALGMLGWPFAGDVEGAEVGHVEFHVEWA